MSCSAGKDKVIALIQYAAMFTSGGEPGLALNVQKSFSAARKPFRLYKVNRCPLHGGRRCVISPFFS